MPAAPGLPWGAGRRRPLTEPLRPPPHDQITLLKYFRNYMSEHLLKAGANITPREGDELARLPYLRTWFRTRSAIVLHLSNGCVQVNFFQVGAAGTAGGTGGGAQGLWGGAASRLDVAPPARPAPHALTALRLPARTTPSSSCAP